MNKYKEIFTKWLAMELMQAGHDLFKVVPNKKNPQYNVYVFVNTNELDMDIPLMTKAKHDLQKLTV
ncbi:hypothetical protein [Sporosarcina psychrophila]|uniref:hypothetical protein n=1 Tax=Sporosarcina psychrophila TaxID=1476 RepID=UPI00078D38CE|nr:hypothetical protein [Sporosarcina psychrophila]AMQ05907.1 hypothetical protein AZE41_08245 [Sporosarcina psychrophila]